MRFLPLVVRAEHRGGFRVRLTFNDELDATVDFERWLQGPVFEPLTEPQYFQRFFVEGGTVVWPNGADIAPETLYEAALAERSHKRLESTATAVRRSKARVQAKAEGRPAVSCVSSRGMSEEAETACYNQPWPDHAGTQSLR